MTSANVTEALFFKQTMPKQVEPATPTNGQFKNILEKQTEFAKKPIAEATKQPFEKPIQKATLSKKNDSVEVNSAEEVPGKEAMADMEKLEEDIEALSADIMAFIADIFGVSLKQVEAFADSQGIEANELLDMEVLGEFTRQFAEAGNPLELLTNEHAFQSFKEVMEYAQSGLENLSQQYQLPKEEIEAVAIRNVVVHDSFETSVHVVGSVSDETTNGMLDDGIDVNVTEQYDLTQNKVMTEDNTERNLNEEGFKEENSVINVSKGNQSDRSSDSLQQESHNHTGNAFAHNTQERDAAVKAKSIPGMTYKDGQMIMNQFEPFLQTQDVHNYTDRETQIRTEDIMRQLMDYMKVSVKPDASDLEMQLHPQSLGNVQIHIANKEGVITARFTTENEAVRATLEGQMIQLKERFEEQGIKVEHIEVTVETHSFDQNLGQNQERSEEGFAGQQRKATRSLLNASLSEDELELLGDEDRLKLQMMETNGNQVDYKA